MKVYILIAFSLLAAPSIFARQTSRLETTTSIRHPDTTTTPRQQVDSAAIARRRQDSINLIFSVPRNDYYRMLQKAIADYNCSREVLPLREDLAGHKKAKSTFNTEKNNQKAIIKRANAMGTYAFDSLFKPILSNVLLGNNDIVQDGSASSFVQDTKEGTLSINYTQIDSGGHWLYNVGVFSKATDGILGIYTANSWSSDVGLDLGTSWIWKRSRYFYASKCQEMDSSRRRQYAGILYKIYTLLDPTIDSEYTRLRDTLTAFYTHGVDYILNNGYRLDSMQKAFKKLDSLKTAKDKLLPAAGIANTDSFYLRRIEEMIGAWEVDNDIYNGYKMYWLSLKGGLSNNRLNLTTDSLDKTYKADYKPKNLIKMSLNLSANGIWQSSKGLRYLRVGVEAALRNLADHPLIQKPGLRFNDSAKAVLLYNNNAIPWEKFSDVKANIITLTPNFYLAWYLPRSKNRFGLDVRADYRFVAKKPEELSKEHYPATYSLAIGPVFRFKQDQDISKGTVGVEVGIMDCPVDAKGKDYFAARFKVGVPFSAFIK